VRSPPSVLQRLGASPLDECASRVLMVTCMKTILFVGVLLLSASPSFAQGHHSGGGGGNWGGNGANGYGVRNWGSIEATGSFGFGRSGVHYEPPATFGVAYGANDGNYVASVYMDYQEALELGKRQLAEMQKANEHPVSLGEIARAYRAAKQADAKRSPADPSSTRRPTPVPPPPHS